MEFKLINICRISIEILNILSGINQEQMNMVYMIFLSILLRLFEVKKYRNSVSPDLIQVFTISYSLISYSVIIWSIILRTY